MHPSRPASSTLHERHGQNATATEALWNIPRELEPECGGLLHGAVAHLHEALIVCQGPPTSPASRALYINPALTQLTGYSIDHLRDHGPQILWGQPDGNAQLAYIESELTAGRVFEGRLLSYRADSSLFFLDVYATPLAQPQPAPDLYMVIMRDAAKDELRDAGIRQIAASLDHVEEGVMVLSRDRRVQYQNRPAVALLGNERAICLPTHAWQHVDQDLPWSGDIEVSAEAGARRLRVKVQHVLGLEGEPSLLVILRDVTEVERLQSIADSVNLSDNLGHFLAGIRHELGNPVNSIKTALTVLRSNLATFPAQKVTDYVERVLGEVGRIEYLLRSLRSFSSHESVTLERVELATIVREVLALVRPSIGNNVTLLADPAPATIVVADRRAVHQILLNLFSNALEAQPEGSSSFTIRLELEEHDAYVEVTVADEGPGMSAEQIESAMKPFFTTKQTGTGLGLVIAQRLAEAQGGRLRVDSTPGVGTRATLALTRIPDRSDRS